MTRFYSFLVIVVMVVGMASHATAQTPEEKTALALLDQAMKLQDAGKHDDALKKLDQAIAKADIPKLHYYKALSLKETGKYVAAYDRLDPLVGKLGDLDGQGKALLKELVTLIPKVVFEVSSSPDGADLFVDGYVSGKTPHKGEITVGSHELKIKKVGFKDTVKTIKVKPGQKVTESMSLDEAHATIKVESDLANAVAFVDGNEKKIKGGVLTIDVLAGPHAVKIVDKGKVLIEDSFDLKEGETKTISSYHFGKVSFTEQIPTAVDADGKATKVEDKSVSLSAGTHTLVLKKAGHKSIKGDVEVKAGTSVPVGVTFTKLADRSTNKLIGWVGFGLGLALVATAITIDNVADLGDTADDVVKWSMMGVGGGLFVGSGVYLRFLYNEYNDPPVVEKKLTTGTKKTPMLSISGTF